MNVDEILTHLTGVKKTGAHRWVSLCPCHEEKTPSLNITETQDKVLAHCFGCGANAVDVVKSLGLSTDLIFSAPLSQDARAARRERLTHQQIDHERLILQMADYDRKNGVRLSAQDLERERQAYLRVKHATA